MSSTSYEILTETIGDSGGRGTSASYILTDTIGNLGAQTESESASFSQQAGYQSQIPLPAFAFSILGGASVTLTPTPSDLVLSTATNTVQTSTSSPFGYTTTVAEVGGFTNGTHTIVDVADGAVASPGVEEYGIGLTGADRAFTDDRSLLNTPRTIASFAGVADARQVTVTYKLTISSSTPGGSYSHLVNYVSSPNY